MTSHELTTSAFPATIMGKRGMPVVSKRMIVLALPLVAITGGCISVKAPDKPIVIELNINIKQEVVYRLAGDAAQTIDKNSEIF